MLSLTRTGGALFPPPVDRVHIVENLFASPSLLLLRASLLERRGDGTFRNSVIHPTILYPTSIVVADFNNNGRLDIVIGGSVLLGNGDGTFQPAPSCPCYSDQLGVADFNGDGNADLVIGDPV